MVRIVDTLHFVTNDMFTNEGNDSKHFINILKEE